MSNVWDDSALADPHAVTDKRRRVQRMFAAIAPSYDLNNRLHSVWLDQAWRRRAVELARLRAGDRVVDVACGTGDLTLAFFDGMHFHHGASNAAQVIGIDFTHEMLPIALGKWMTAASAKAVAVPSVRFINGDAQALPLPDACCDVVSIAFGIRNVADPAAAADEFFRILRPGGRVVILEFSLPTNPAFRALYNLYIKQILPHTATLISGDKTGAYKYLPQSINTFIDRETMVNLLAHAGFHNIIQRPLSFGICVCYRGIKGGRTHPPFS